MNKIAKVISANLHLRKITIWIILLWFITMLLGSVAFRLLLLDVVPSEYLFVCEIVIEIKWSTRKVKSLGIWILCKEFDDTLAKRSASTFVSFINYNQVPLIHQDVLLQLFIMVATHKSGATQILH